jgi:chromosome segregation ATPase
VAINNIPQPEEYGEHIARLNAESLEYRRRMERLEENYKRLDNQLQTLQNNQTKTHTLVETVVTRFDGFESRILAIFAQMTADSAKLLQSMTKQSGQATQGWQKTVVEVIKLTVAALVGYLITRGGGMS